MKEDARFAILKNQPSKADLIDEIRNDPVRDALWDVFVTSLAPGDQARARDSMQKRLSPEHKGLYGDEQAWVQNLAQLFIQREQAGKRVLANLDVTEQQKFASYVTQNLTTVDRNEFPLWVMGVAVYGEEDSAGVPIIEHLAQAARAWKTAIRDTVSAEKAGTRKDDVDRLAAHYGITSEEINTYIAMDNDNERLAELAGSIERVPRLRTAVQLFMQPFRTGQTGYKSRAEALNELIIDYREKSSGLTQSVNQAVAILSAIETKGHPLFEKIPDILARQTIKERDASVFMDQQSGKEYTSEDAMFKRFAAFLEETYGPEAREIFERERVQFKGHPSRLLTRPIPFGASGATSTIDDAWDRFAAHDSTQLQRMSWASQLMKFIFELFSIDAWDSAKRHIA